jgi:hypothetical protein
MFEGKVKFRSKVVLASFVSIKHARYMTYCYYINYDSGVLTWNTQNLTVTRDETEKVYVCI